MADPSVPPPVGTAAPTAVELWEWLAACLDCGKPHEYRPAQACSECPDCRHRNRLWTWACPDDGHAYRRRISQDVARLRAEWEASCG